MLSAAQQAVAQQAVLPFAAVRVRILVRVPAARRPVAELAVQVASLNAEPGVEAAQPDAVAAAEAVQPGAVAEAGVAQPDAVEVREAA